MFHFPTFPPLTLCVQVRVTGHDSSRVSPFGNPRINVRLPTPRGLSQPPTSFFGSWCQGIHRAPLLTWPQRCSRPLCSSQDTGGISIRTIACPAHGVVRWDRSLTVPARAGLGLKCGNSRSFRTQQRAWATSWDDSAFHTPGGCTSSIIRSVAYWSMFHSDEHHPRNECPRRGSGCRRTGTRCSLERR
jgi:hypothetical protein